MIVKITWMAGILCRSKLTRLLSSTVHHALEKKSFAPTHAYQLQARHLIVAYFRLFFVLGLYTFGGSDH